MRLAALWLLLAAAYAATASIPAVRGSDYGGSEPHHLLVAESIVSDGDVDLGDEYRDRAWARWQHATLRPDGRLVAGRLREREGIGFGALIAPAYALGGPRAVELMLAAIAALAFVLAALLARRLVPEPWASGGAALAGLSPPALAAATSVTPGIAGGAALGGAALCALAVRVRPRARVAYLGALLLAPLPWLAASLAIPGAVVAWALVTWTLRARRRVAALVVAEALAGSLTLYALVDERLYGGLTPSAVGWPWSASLERAPRLVALWLDRDAGLLRWAPVLALAFVGAWRLYVSRRDRLARLAPTWREAEACAGLLLAVAGAQLVIATFGPQSLRGPWFAGAPLAPALPALAALAAWGLRHVPRPVGAALGALALAASAWLLAGLWGGRLGGWLSARTDAPWGPLVRALPRFGTDDAGAAALIALLGAGLLAIALRERRTRRAWSGRTADGARA